MNTEVERALDDIMRQVNAKVEEWLAICGVTRDTLAEYGLEELGYQEETREVGFRLWHKDKCVARLAIELTVNEGEKP